jgi:hypothetical protein
LYILGGRQRTLRPLTSGLQHWYEYDKGLILDLDARTGEATTVVEYASPPEACPPVDAAILFKSGTLVGDRLYACTQTEILVYRLPSFELVDYLSLPVFNDLHHVRPTERGTLLVAATGLDMVFELSTDGDIVNEWTTLDERPWTRFSRSVDYRRIATTKPHLSHPNYVFCLGDEVWATRFHQKDAISLTNPPRRIEIGLERPHDGLVHDGHIYFTTVNGMVVVVSAESLSVVEVIDLTAMHPRDTLLGWCRGIGFDGDVLWVGYSRIRPTKFRENVGWIARGFKRDFGTHVACYDLKARRCVLQYGVERFGVGAVFSVLAEPEALRSVPASTGNASSGVLETATALTPSA